MTFVLLCAAGGDSAGGNLTICALEYMRQRAAGSVDPALTAADAAAAGSASANKHSNSSSVAVPFHPPVAALLVSPAVDLSGSSVFARPAAEVAEIFRYDYVVKSEGDTDSSGEQCALQTWITCWLACLQADSCMPAYVSAFRCAVTQRYSSEPLKQIRTMHSSWPV
jgi:acetyl esterase/lipase